ncbi:hypothetical protein ACQ4PT_012612 [Festuca glaucescens]
MLQTYSSRRRRTSGAGSVAMVERYPVPPDDVIEDIFARLPAKAVCRFRCLSRTWAARLVSDDFADRHFLVANGRGGPRILFMQKSNPYYDRCEKLQRWSPENPRGTTLAPFWHSVQGHDTDIFIARPVTQQCRGLFIVEAKTPRAYYVFNPSTGQIAELPKSPAMDRSKHTRLGLAYDSSTRKHIAVCILYCGHPGRNPGFNGCEVYVINSTTRKWRSVDGCSHKKQMSWIHGNTESVFAQRNVHWLAQREFSAYWEETFVFSFSLEDETFRTMSLPPLEIGRNRRYQRLTELRGQLCLFSTDMDNGFMWARRHDVWLLRRHNTCAWDLHCRIDVDTLPPKVASFMRHGHQISMLGNTDGGRGIILLRLASWSKPSFALCSYDPVTNDMEILIDDGGLVSNTSNMVFGHAALYEDSIASPGQPLTTFVGHCGPSGRGNKARKAAHVGVARPSRPMRKKRPPGWLANGDWAQ